MRGHRRPHPREPRRQDADLHAGRRRLAIAHRSGRGAPRGADRRPRGGPGGRGSLLRAQRRSTPRWRPRSPRTSRRWLRSCPSRSAAPSRVRPDAGRRRGGLVQTRVPAPPPDPARPGELPARSARRAGRSRSAGRTSSRCSPTSPCTPKAGPERGRRRLLHRASRARTDLGHLREWLGTNPRTGDSTCPLARARAPTSETGVKTYQVEDVLVDVDLFRRLRARGQARGAEGIGDLMTAMRLVEGCLRPPPREAAGAGFSTTSASTRPSATRSSTPPTS